MSRFKRAIAIWVETRHVAAAGLELDVQAESVVGILRIHSRSADQIAVRVGGAEDRNRRRVNVCELTRRRVEIQEGNVGTVEQFVGILACFSTMRMGQYGDLRASSGGGQYARPSRLDRTGPETPCSPIEGTHGQSKAIGHGSRRSKAGIGFLDAVRTEEGPVVLGDRGGACEDALVGKQRHPVRTAFDTRFVGRYPAGDTKRKPVLDSPARRKIEPECVFTAREIDGKMASAAGGERKSKTNVDLDEGRDELHLEKTARSKGGDDRLGRSQSAGL